MSGPLSILPLPTVWLASESKATTGDPSNPIREFDDAVRRIEAAAAAAHRRIVLTGRTHDFLWGTIPSWYEVGTLDKVIPPTAQLAMAKTAQARVVEVRSSHLPMISQPGAVTDTIEDAVSSIK